MSLASWFRNCIHSVLCADEILLNAGIEDVAFLVVGDPFGFVLSSSLQIHYIASILCI